MPGSLVSTYQVLEQDNNFKNIISGQNHQIINNHENAATDSDQKEIYAQKELRFSITGRINSSKNGTSKIRNTSNINRPVSTQKKNQIRIIQDQMAD